MSDGTRAWVWVDAHVHLHPTFSCDAAFAAVRHRLEELAESEQDRSRHAVLLLMTESRGSHAFAHMASGGGLATACEYRAHTTAEPSTLAVQSRRAEHPPILVVAGRQIQTAEGLEVLALGLVEETADGRDLATTLDSVRTAGALPVVPWGFGKWWLERGRLLARELTRQPRAEFFLGDNGGRCTLGAEPRMFARARRHGIRVLPGSDPLPFPEQARRVGAYGFRIPGPLDHARPWQWLSSRLRDPGLEPVPFGSRTPPLPFARNQIRMQWRKRLGRPRR